MHTQRSFTMKLLAVIFITAGIVALKPAKEPAYVWIPQYASVGSTEQMSLSRVVRNVEAETLILFGFNGESKTFDFNGLTFRIENDCPEGTVPYATIETTPLVNGNDPKADAAPIKTKVIIHTNMTSSKAGFQAGYTVER